MDDSLLPWGGYKDMKEEKLKKEKMEDFILALRYGWLILPEEIVDLIEEQHYWYSLGKFGLASDYFHDAFNLFIKWREENYGQYGEE